MPARRVLDTLETEQLQTVRRALAVLEALAARPAGASPKELSQVLDLHLSTCYRLLNALVAAGYALRTGGLFRVGARVAYVHRGFLEAVQPPPGVVPFIHALQVTTGETAMLNQLEADNVMSTVTVAGTRPGAHPPGYVGQSAPAHAMAAGRVLLASLSAAQIEGYLARHAPGSRFPITNPASLCAELEQIRQLGYGLDRGDDNPNVCCVAAPVTGPSGTFAAVAIVAPCTRLRREETALVPTVVEVARAIGSLWKSAAPRDDRAAADLPAAEAATQAAIEAALVTLDEAMSSVAANRRLSAPAH
jgi:IclR family acetate operon transcriptional repressor